ncbi:MAG: glutathione S-transferase [Nannocystaceae bacterium]|nr:glutathione S-transferase [Nannocystaceae bacterium]
MNPPYELYYWPVLPGRGEVIRMILEDGEVPYRDVARQEGFSAITSAREGALGEPRPFAPPVLKHGELVLSQSAVIARYLGERHGLAPAQETGRLLAEQHFLGWDDLMHEVHDTHHPIAVGLRYEDQREAASQRSRHFLADRLEPWLQHFERLVTRGDGHHVPGTLTYADFMARFVLRGIAYAFPKAFAHHSPKLPSLLDLVERIEARPALAAYLASERCMSFNENGIFRHYPELDL